MESIKKCPNPNGELGICYDFDRFGDRCGCVGCPLLETLPNGVMNEGDPLPGLSKQLKPKEGDLIPGHNSLVHYKPNGERIECHAKSYWYILELESIINCIKLYCENGSESTLSMMDLYRSWQKNKDDFASELHLLLRDTLHFDDILDIIKKGLK